LAGTDGQHDIPLPLNVRRYYFPGTQHGGGEGGFSTRVNSPPDEPNPCLLPPNPNPETETMRALLVALTEWVTKGIAPPESRYPTLAAGALTTEAALKFPTLPGLAKSDDLANPMFDYDFGPHFNTRDMSGYIDHQPPVIRQVVPILVPAVDADGNEQSGVLSVLHDAPLGTYLGWNINRSGIYAGQICTLAGSFIPFANTRAERLKQGDPRLSIEERYGDRQGYRCAVESAAKRSVKARFLLEDDAQRLIDEATTATSSGDLAFLPNALTARGQALCARVSALNLGQDHP
jgi:Alpha/beta hydrolase domain